MPHTLEEIRELWAETHRRHGINDPELLEKHVQEHFEQQRPLQMVTQSPPMLEVSDTGEVVRTTNVESILKEILYALYFIGVLLLILVLISAKAHGQFSRINTIGIQHAGSQVGFQASPFNLNFIGCSVTLSGNTYSISCAGGGTGCIPGGTTNSVLADDGAGGCVDTGTGTTGQVLIWQPSGPPAFADPLVQGTQAAGSTTLPNPVVIGGSDYAGTPAVQTAKVTSAGVLQTHETGTATVSGTVAATQSGTWTVQPGNTANTTAWKVDGSAVTQPVSAVSLPLPTGAATAAKQPALGTAGSPSVDVISIQGVASGTAVPVSGSLTTSPPANATTNVTQWAGTAVDTNSGSKSAGTLRVTLATDQVQLTNALKVDGSAVTQPVSNTGLTDLDSTIGTPGSAAPSKSQQVAGTDGTNAIVPFIDPCQRGAKTYTAINVASTTATKLVSQASSKIIYVCSINLISAGANNVVLITGTKTTTECDTTTAAMNGGTTAATGWNLAANGGIVVGNGSSAIMAGGTTKDVCVIASASTQLSGTIVTVAY